MLSCFSKAVIMEERARSSVVTFTGRINLEDDDNGHGQDRWDKNSADVRDFTDELVCSNNGWCPCLDGKTTILLSEKAMK